MSELNVHAAAFQDSKHHLFLGIRMLCTPWLLEMLVLTEKLLQINSVKLSKGKNTDGIIVFLYKKILFYIGIIVL